MRKRGLRRFLKKEFATVNENALTEKTRVVISEILTETLATFRSDKKAVLGIKRAFEETVLPGYKRHSELEQFLKAGKDVPAVVQPPLKKKRWDCPDCNEAWSTAVTVRSGGYSND